MGGKRVQGGCGGAYQDFWDVSCEGPRDHDADKTGKGVGWVKGEYGGWVC